MENGRYRTSDTSLAAYLKSKGEKFLAVEVDDTGKGFFIFEGSETLDRLILDWDTVNPTYRYYQQYRLMLRLLNNEIKAIHRKR